MDKKLQDEIKDLICKKVLEKLKSHDFSKTSGNPFVDLMFGKYPNIKYFIHGTATMMGSQYEIIARKIAESNPDFTEAKKMLIEGEISDSERAKIGTILRQLEAKQRKPNYFDEIKEIYSVSSEKLTKIKITIDLYLKTKEGKEYFIEMKGPDPNKKEVRAAKDDLLNLVGIKKRNIQLGEFNKKVELIFGVYYNNNKGKYKNWKVSPMFEENRGLLVQEEFWDLIGGKGTYKELLEIMEEVKSIVVSQIEDKFHNL